MGGHLNWKFKWHVYIDGGDLKMGIILYILIILSDDITC